MSFVTLDDKDWCKGIYTNGKLYFNKFPANLDKTWRYSSFFDDGKVLFGHLWCGGKTLEQVCPQNLKNQLEIQNKKLDAFYRAFKESKVDLNDNCFYDLVPNYFLLEYCDLKSQIIDSIFENYKKPQNYDFYLSLERLLTKIKSRNLNLDLKKMNLDSTNVLKRNNFIKSLKNIDKTINYNQFGTKTGRLSTYPRSFPILTMNSDYRDIIKPVNKLFLELDYNAAEARVLLALAGIEQPKEDIHEWNAKKLNITREEAKKGLFSWLYGSKNSFYEKFSHLYDIKNVLNKYYDGKVIKNPFGRVIESDQYHFLNYLIQSTTADLVLRQILKIQEYLANDVSFISCIIHDAVLLDVEHDDRKRYREIADIFGHNCFGFFPVNISIGKDYGNMSKIIWKC